MINKGGMSDVVATIVMITLTIVVVSIVWTSVNGIIKNQTSKAKDCFKEYGQLTLDPSYTCFNQSEGKFYFLIKRENIDIDQILVGISSDGSPKDIYINATNANYIIMDKNSARRYNDSFSTVPTVISIFPIVNGRQCEQADSLTQIENC